MHKLTVNIPDELMKPVKRIAIDSDTNLTKIITARFQEIAATGTISRADVEALKQPLRPDAPPPPAESE